MPYQDQRQAAILELKRLIAEQSGAGDAPRATGGPFDLSLAKLLREVENDTRIGRDFVEAFAILRQQFPAGG
jgi:hypothetical protein